MSVLAHAGGWDEILIFGSPFIVYVLWRMFDRPPEPDEADEAPAESGEPSH